ncbi:GNAT family N-acetyltransferase [Lentilactobacillus hilgardii]|uniref:GNAT family N-acetyltransferase n=1 Tax=Lentilactobacillus hilgardii TaxID=1588 RepID=UPI0039E9A1AD
MAWQVAQLTQENALIVANDWHYDGKYAFFDMTADPEDYQEIISPVLRKDHYYQVLNENKTLVGVFAIEPIDTERGTYELGLGLAPRLTGQGLGQNFLDFILDDIQKNFSVSTIILDVAEFNVRAQKVYQKLGFKAVRRHSQKTNCSTYPFIEMRRDFRN